MTPQPPTGGSDAADAALIIVRVEDAINATLTGRPSATYQSLRS